MGSKNWGAGAESGGGARPPPTLAAALAPEPPQKKLTRALHQHGVALRRAVGHQAAQVGGKPGEAVGHAERAVQAHKADDALVVARAGRDFQAGVDDGEELVAGGGDGLEGEERKRGG